MDILTTALILCVILSAFAVAYFFAESRGRKAIIEKQDEIIGVLRSECKDWQNKALFRQGISPLGRETEKPADRKPEPFNGTPRVAMRAQRMARAAGEPETQSITIHGHEVVNPHTQETVEKAKELKRKAEMQTD